MSNCGRITFLRTVDGDEQCLRCGAHLRSCNNCLHYDGAFCRLRQTAVADPSEYQSCAEFAFRVIDREPPAR